MTGRSTVLVHGGMTISFYCKSAIDTQHYVENNSCFDQLIFYALDELLTRQLDNYELFHGNLNFHEDREGNTQS